MDTTNFYEKLVVCLDNAKDAREVINRLNNIGYFTADAYKNACEGIADENFPAKYHFLFDENANPSAADAVKAFHGLKNVKLYWVDKNDEVLAEISYF